ncbi:hypothetical protein TNCV_3458831 [Trichonephila clavipes]|nr:hypothetical protein TNCV_3458831 [Trichonephila clavipes]
MRAARKRPSTRRYTAYGLESVFGNVTENDQMPCEPLPKIAYNILHTNPTPFPYCASKQFCIIRSEAYEFGSKGGSHFSTGKAHRIVDSGIVFKTKQTRPKRER